MFPRTTDRLKQVCHLGRSLCTHPLSSMQQRPHSVCVVSTMMFLGDAFGRYVVCLLLKAAAVLADHRLPGGMEALSFHSPGYGSPSWQVHAFVNARCDIRHEGGPESGDIINVNICSNISVM